MKNKTKDRFEKQHTLVQEQLLKMSPSVQKSVRDSQEVIDNTLEEINTGFEEGEEIANRWRRQGYLPSEATDILKTVSKRDIGEIVNVHGTLKVLTPFKTVVDAQTYIYTLQNRLMELSSISAETEIILLKSTINKFTSLSFFGLISLAFKRLLNMEK